MESVLLAFIPASHAPPQFNAILAHKLEFKSQKLENVSASMIHIMMTLKAKSVSSVSNSQPFAKPVKGKESVWSVIRNSIIQKIRY